jgi:hypothetical protein
MMRRIVSMARLLPARRRGQSGDVDRPLSGRHAAARRPHPGACRASTEQTRLSRASSPIIVS